MTRNLHLFSTSLIACVLLGGSSVHAITFKLVGQLDAGSLAIGAPGSIAAHGSDLYVGNLFGDADLHHITNPLTSPTKVNTFGGLNTPASNGGLPVLANPVVDTTTDGYVSLHTDGNILVASTINGGKANGDGFNPFPATARPDIIQTYTFGSDTLIWGSNSDNLDIGGNGYQGQGTDAAGLSNARSLAGSAVDPVTGRVVALSWASAEQYVLPTAAPPALVPLAQSPSLMFIGNIPGAGSTGWRDVNFDEQTGDIVAYGVDGIVRGDRVADHRYAYHNNPANVGVRRIVNFNTFGFPFTKDFATAVNVEFLPADFAGQELVIFNKRDRADTFTDQVLVYDANNVNTAVAVDFVMSDGTTPFTTLDATSGIYDFSFDSVNSKLYISDLSSAQIYVFDVPGAGLPGDFDADGDVDGRDFLVWQRNPAVGALADWKANYGTGGSLAAVAIPEPASGAVVALGLGAWIVLFRPAPLRFAQTSA